MHLLHSTSQSPSDNIALEESLLEQDDEQPTLLFWQSRSAVILGKNQNPWLELNLSYCREHGIEIARRFTGGGCVYQDKGNLNYTLIHPREGYSMTRILDSVAASFQQEGLPAERIMENSLGIDGKKFSGHAFCFRRDRVLHHGTLLINANLDHLWNSLLPGGINLDSHAVLSRSASVGNLSDFSLDEAQARRLLIRGLESTLGQSVTGEIKLQAGDFQDLDRTEKFSSNEWVWGQTPAFTIVGDLEGEPIRIKVRRMKIESMEGAVTSQELVGLSFLAPEDRLQIRAVSAPILAILEPYLFPE
jgi:lipoate-protein ligase A